MIPDNSGRYWIAIDPATLRVLRRQRMDQAPTLAQMQEGIWFACGKKLWSKVRAGDVLAVEDLPANVIERLVKRR